MDFFKNISISKKIYLALFVVGLSSLIGYGLVSYNNLSTQRERDLVDSFRSNSQSLATILKNDLSSVKREIEKVIWSQHTLKSTNHLRLDKISGFVRLNVVKLRSDAPISVLNWKEPGTYFEADFDNKITKMIKHVAGTDKIFLEFDADKNLWNLSYTTIVDGVNYVVYSGLSRQVFFRDFWHSGFGDVSLFVGADQESGVVINQSKAVGTLWQGEFWSSPNKNVENSVFRLSDNSYVTTNVIGKDLRVVSYLPEEYITSAIRVFFVKSFLFFLLVFSAIPIFSILSSHFITKRLRELTHLTKETAQGNFKSRVENPAKDEIGVLGTNFNFMNEKIEELLMETREKARMEGELKIAQNVQTAILPEGDYRDNNIEISGYYKPASECGGDLWTFKETANKVYFCIGDATGHGVAPALVTTAANSVINLIDELGEPNIASVMSALNKVIYKTAKGGINMTFFMAVIDKKTLLMDYCCASHDPPIVYNVSTNNIDYLSDKVSRRLGEAVDYAPSICQYQLESHQRVLCYTDGITELKNHKGRDYGLKRLTKLWVQLGDDGASLNQSIDEIEKVIFAYQGDEPQDDDITYCVLNVS